MWLFHLNQHLKYLQHTNRFDNILLHVWKKFLSRSKKCIYSESSIIGTSITVILTIPGLIEHSILSVIPLLTVVWCIIFEICGISLITLTEVQAQCNFVLPYTYCLYLICQMVSLSIIEGLNTSSWTSSIILSTAGWCKIFISTWKLTYLNFLKYRLPYIVD